MRWARVVLPLAIVFIGLVVAGWGFSSGGFGVFDAGAVGEFRPTVCAGDLRTSGRRVECGVVTVLEDPDAPSGRRLKLRVAILRALKPLAGSLPVIYLHGGPGGGVLADLAASFEAPIGHDLAGLDQDWIFFDQRGTGLSEPLLDCGRIALNDAGPASPDVVADIGACMRRHERRGVDFTQYTSSAVVRDIGSIRRALDIKQYDVFSLSYGTRVAFTLLRDDPEGVRAVVVDSPWPVDALWTEPGPGWVSREVREVLRACEKDPQCNARHPGVEAALDRSMRTLLEGPIEVRGVTYTSGMLAQFLMDALYDAGAVRALPANLARLSRGDFAPLDAYLEGAGAGYSEAQHLAVLCNEELGFERPERVLANASGDPVAEAIARTMVNYFSACETFRHRSADPREQVPVSSAVATLFLAAGIDAGCPAELSQGAVGRFGKGQLVIAANTTHGVARNSGCGRRLARAFLRAPDAALDHDCLLREAVALQFE